MKEYYGGNKQDGKHHPLAAGEIPKPFAGNIVLIVPASSGAAATIASDALMNPFDGRYDSDAD